MESNKFKKFENEIYNLTIHHYQNSKLYKKILDNLNFDKKKKYTAEELPFLPARLFKHLELKSIADKQIFKVLKSSGTSGQQSKIFLDIQNTINQRKILKELFETYVSRERLPMFILGKDPKHNRFNFDAKAAAILGFSMFGKNHKYFIDKYDKENLKSFTSIIENHKKIIFFGFTSDVYNFFFKTLKNYKNLDLSKIIVLHGGGWKKLEKIKISNLDFKKKLKNNFNIKKVINYYGLVEQIGSVFFECPKCNLFICSKYSDIIIRDKKFTSQLNKKGMVQLLSLLPKSYPGHNILTEDIGKIFTNVNCDKNHQEKMFKIYGRIENSEIRGCSNV